MHARARARFARTERVTPARAVLAYRQIGFHFEWVLPQESLTFTFNGTPRRRVAQMIIDRR